MKFSDIILAFKGITVFALVGPSGTGKSFRAKLVVELDGGGHYYPEQEHYDAIRTKKLEELGLKVMRICNLDVDRNFYGVCTAIDMEVKQRMGLPVE